MTICDPMDHHGPPDSSLCEISQGCHFIFRDLPRPGIKPASPALTGGFLAPELPIQFSSVAQSCLTLCNPMDCSMPGLLVHQQLPELAQTHFDQVGHAIQPSSVIPFSSCLQSFPASRSFAMSLFFTSCGQSTGASASASVLPMNIQD